MYKEKVYEFIRERKEAFTVCGLMLLCFLLYFVAMGSYPLMDPYETKFVSIARSMYKTGELFVLNLNGSFFFETPPLFFWLETLAFSVFGRVSETIARIPVAFCATAGVFLVYIFCRKIISRKHAVVSSLILATSLLYVIFAKLAVMAMLFSVCIGISVYTGLYPLFCSEAHKKYFWWLSYIFAAFGLLTSGMFGVLIPLTVILVSYCMSRKFKEMFKPVFILPGLLFFFLVALPWHWIMVGNYSPMFFNEYIVKQHVDKYWYVFANSEQVPWYVIIGLLLGAFLPWIFSFVAQSIVFFKDKIKQVPKYFLDFDSLNFPQKFMLYNIIYFLVVIIFFSLSATKQPVYVLPALMPVSVILGKFWIDYFDENKHRIAVNITMVLWTLILAAASIAVFFVPDFFKGQTRQELVNIQPEILFLLLVVITMQIFSYIRKAKRVLFASLVVLMTGFSMIASIGLFNVICSTGQHELVLYSLIAKNEEVPLATYGLKDNYSVIYYYGKDLTSFSEKQLDDVLSLSKSYPETRFVVSNSILATLSERNTFKIVANGEKYSFIENITPKKD